MSALSDLNYIKRAWKVPCHFGDGGVNEVNIIIETAIVAAIPVLLGVNSFSCLDIIKARSGISWKCGRALKAAVTTKNSAKALNRNRLIYSITGAALLEQALWYWFVAGLASEFFANWTSLMYAELGCNQPNHDTISATIALWDLDPGDSPQRAPFASTQSNSCASFGFNTIVVQPGCQVQIVFQVDLEPLGPGIPVLTVQAQLTRLSDGHVFDSTAFWSGNSGGQTGPVGASMNLSGGLGGEAYAIELLYSNSDPGFAKVASGSCWVTTMGRPVRLTPASCFPKATQNPFSPA
jgi:hypothetical protein